MVALLIANLFDGGNLIEKRICVQLFAFSIPFFLFLNFILFLYALLIKLFLLDIQRPIIFKVNLFPAVCIVLTGTCE